MLITGRYLLVVFSEMVSKYRPFPVLIFLTVNTYCSPLVPLTFDQEYLIRLPFIALTSTILNGYFSPGITIKEAGIAGFLIMSVEFDILRL